MSWPVNKSKLFAELGYEPSAGQAAFHASEARFRVLIAGARFGKSLAAAKEVVPVLLQPGTRTWICGPTYELAQKEFDYVVADVVKLLGREATSAAVSGTSAHRQALTLPWEASVTTKSAQRPESLLGEELDLLVVSEASRIPGDVWERFLYPRLGTRLGRAVIPTTPAGMGDWVHEAYQRGLDARQPDWESFGPFATAENPAFSDAEFELARRTVPEEVFNEQYLGRFVHRSGLVYPEFERRRHVISEPPKEWRNWPVYRAIDFGYRNPFVCLWVAKPPGASTPWYVVDELYTTELLVEDAAREITRRSKGLRIVATVADHDAEDRATLKRHGIPTRAAVKAVQPGIERVKSALRSNAADRAPQAVLQETSNAVRPGLRVNATCKNLIAEFETYAWQPQDPGEPRNAPQQPRPYMDHALDALRYLLATYGNPTPQTRLPPKGRRAKPTTRTPLRE